MKTTMTEDYICGDCMGAGIVKDTEGLYWNCPAHCKEQRLSPEDAKKTLRSILENQGGCAMLREVTLYTAQKKRVLAGDYVEMFKYGSHEPPYHIKGTDQFLCAETPKDTVEILQLPVHELCEDKNGEVLCEYIAVDPTIRRLIAAVEERARTKESLALYWQNISDAYWYELSNLKKMTFIQKLIFAFTKQKENSNA